MSTNAKATGFLELNINGFDQAIKTAKNLMMGLAATFGAYKLGEFFKDGIKDAIDFGKEMQSASKAMGGFDANADAIVTMLEAISALLSYVIVQADEDKKRPPK